MSMHSALGPQPDDAAALPMHRQQAAADMADRPAAADLGLWERGVAAGTAAFISTLVVNPLELVKTRMQVQASALASDIPSPVFRYSNAGFSGLRCTPAWRTAASAQIVQPPPVYRSALEGLLRIARHEGPAVLWRGTDVSLMVAVPMVMLNLPLYEALLKRFQQSTDVVAAPLLAGAAARTAVVFATSPLELVRVRMQGQGPPAKAMPYGQHIAQVVRQLYNEGKGRGLARYSQFWRGVGATLAKDVPFAAGYWMLFEPSRRLLLSQQLPGTELQEQHAPSPAHAYIANATAGFGAALVAAGATTPLDTVKTTEQMGAARKGMAQTAADIVRRGGVRALFAGAGPRSMRAGCAYAILMSSYEAFKSLELRAH